MPMDPTLIECIRTKLARKYGPEIWQKWLCEVFGSWAQSHLIDGTDERLDAWWSYLDLNYRDPPTAAHMERIWSQVHALVSPTSQTPGGRHRTDAELEALRATYGPAWTPQDETLGTAFLERLKRCTPATPKS